MIEIDLTQEVVAVATDTDEGSLRILTGYCPEVGKESVHRLDGEKRVSLDDFAGAQVRGRGIQTYLLRERTLTEAGVYEIQCQVRRGPQRHFTLDISEGDSCLLITVRAGSSPAFWIVNDQEPHQHKTGDLVLKFDEMPTWHDKIVEDALESP